MLQALIFFMQKENKPICLTVTEKGKCGSLFFGGNGLTELSLRVIKSDINKFDFAIINLYRIIQEFFSNEKIRDEVVEKISILNDKENKILEIIRTGDFKELSIKLKNNNKYLIGIKRNKSIDKITNEVSSIIARNKYEEIKLITQKGNIVVAEITETIII